MRWTVSAQTPALSSFAATNRRDILDPALLRPGRFDRQIVVGYPDVKGREEILKVHARNKPMGPDVNLKTVAKATVGFTGADLENVVNEAALLAARANKHAITMKEIEDATIKVIAGPEKRSKVVTEKERRLTAYHEAATPSAPITARLRIRCMRSRSFPAAWPAATPCRCRKMTAATSQ